MELALGVRHATASKKNWALMTASFALSIVLALGFTVLLQFASLLLPSLVPWQPDVLYNGYGNAQVLPGSMTRTLLEVPASPMRGAALVWWIPRPAATRATWTTLSSAPTMIVCWSPAVPWWYGVGCPAQAMK